MCMSWMALSLFVLWRRKMCFDFRPTLNHLLKSNELTTALETLRSIVNEMCMLRIVLICAVKNNVFWLSTAIYHLWLSWLCSRHFISSLHMQTCLIVLDGVKLLGRGVFWDEIPRVHVVVIVRYSLHQEQLLVQPSLEFNYSDPL